MRTTCLVIVSALILCMGVCALNMERAKETSGTCGENVEWRLDGTTLNIKGTGNMTDYMYSPPWSSLTFDTVVIEEGVTSIGDHAFYVSRSLTNVTIPESVVSIGTSAFYYCIALPKIVIPAGVKFIGEEVFKDCSALTSIEVEDGNTNYASRDGVLFDHDFTTIINYPMANDRTEYVFPDTVKYIGNNVFESCSSLKTVTIGDSVTTIGAHSFSNCHGLTTVTIGDNVESIDDQAFYRCDALTTLKLGEGLKVIRELAFGYCDALSTVVIPSSVYSIGSQAFHGCGNLTSFEVEDGNMYYAARDGVLFNHDFTTILRYPISLASDSYVVPDSVTLIEEYAFTSCKYLKSVRIGENVNTIGQDAFAGSVLESVYISDSVEWLIERTFCSCSNLKDVRIGEKVRTIPHDAFGDCKSLETITIPDSVEMIERYAFEACSNLKSVTFGNGLLEIDEAAFTDCRSLINVVIPDSVSTIGRNAFAYCPGLTSITIGANVSSIGDGAFNVFYYMNNLTNVYYKSRHPISNSLFTSSQGYSHLVNVCVPSDYESTSFGGVNVTNTTTCQQFQSMLFNYCYTPIGIDDTLTQVKRQNATEFERRSNGCVEYRCNNDTEPSITPLCKGDKPFCIQDKCRAENSLDGFDVRVELDLKEGVTVNLIDEDEIKDTLKTRFGLGGDDVAIGYELDEEGYVLRVTLYLNDMDIGKVIVDSVNNHENPTGFFRLVERARIYGPEMFLSGTEGMMSSMLGTVFVLLLIENLV